MHGPVDGGGGSSAIGYNWAAFSEIGKRERNEDRWGYRRVSDELTIWVVADGLGGHADGHVAAAAAVQAFLDHASANVDDVKGAARAGIAAARTAVAALQDETNKGKAPSSTLVGFILSGAVGLVCHAGDSALFQFRGHEVVHRTRDHNIRELKLAVGASDESPVDDPDAAILTRTLADPLPEGAEDVFSELCLRPGDLILICSDGVAQHIPRAESAQWASSVQDEGDLLQKARESVLQADLQRQDNYTAVAIALGASTPTPVLQIRRRRPVVMSLLAALALLGLLLAAWQTWRLSKLTQPSAKQANAAELAHSKGPRRSLTESTKRLNAGGWAG